MTALTSVALTLTAMTAAALIIIGARPTAPTPSKPRDQHRQPTVVRMILGTDLPLQRRRWHQRILIAAIAAGALVWAFTGWVLAVFLAPALALGLPALLRPSTGRTDEELLTGLESWTRGIAGRLVIGASIEHALLASMSSAVPAMRPAVQSLVARLRASWRPDTALRAFGDDLDDATADLVVAALIMGVGSDGAGLATALEDLADTVAEEVRVRRAIETDRATPRTVARMVTLISVGMLTWLGATGYLAPYGSGLGSVAFAVLLAAYAGCLLWAKAMSRGERTPRFLPPTTRET